MQVLILGVSGTSIRLANKLVSKGEDVVIVDKNASEAVEAEHLSNVTAIDGIFFDIEVLQEAGIEKTDIVCALSENETMNLMAAQIAKEKFHIKKVVTMIISSKEFRIYEDMGIVPVARDLVVADALFEELHDSFTLSRGVTGASDVHSIFGRNYKFVLYEATDELIGTKLKNLVETEDGFIMALVRNGDVITPNRNIKVEKGDRIITAILLDT